MNIDLLRQRLAADPHNPLFRFSLAQALSQQSEWDEAIEHLLFCSESRADWMLPRIMLGKALIENGDPESAIPWLREGLRLAVEQNHEDPAVEARRLLEETGASAE